jgi:hypothetical protein
LRKQPLEVTGAPSSPPTFIRETSLTEGFRDDTVDATEFVDN